MAYIGIGHSEILQFFWSIYYNGIKLFYQVELSYNIFLDNNGKKSFFNQVSNVRPLI